MNVNQIYEALGVSRGALSLLDPTLCPKLGVECLASYIMRNKMALGRKLVGILDQNASFLSNDELELASRILCTSRQVPLSLCNGLKKSETMTSALSGIYPSFDFRQMIAGGVNISHLAEVPKLKKSIYWCTSCAESSAKQNIDIWIPLQWQLLGFNRCSVHDEVLVSICGHCGSKFSSFDFGFMDGKCKYCGNPIGTKNCRIATQKPPQQDLFEK